MTDEIIKKIIEELKLEPLPIEGGYFRQTYICEEILEPEQLPIRYKQNHSLGTAIYFMLEKNRFPVSMLHKLKTDEIYHFYLGDPVTILLLFPEKSSQRVTMGSDIMSGQKVQVLVPKDTWQAVILEPVSSFALMGTSMAPGYRDEDITFALREELLLQYPSERENIIKTTLPRERTSKV
jgi:predicted cupin superfamily sugar epimerase